MGRPFHMDVDRLLDADLDELSWFLELMNTRAELERPDG